MLHVVRAVFVLAVLFIAVSYATTKEIRETQVDRLSGRPIGLSPLIKVTLVIMIPVVLAVALMVADTAFHNKSLGGISGLFFGVVAGIVLAYILGMVVELAASVFMPAQVPAGRPTEPRARLRKAPAGSTTQPAGKKEARERVAEEAEAAEEAGGPLPPSMRSPLVAMIKLLVGAFVIYLCVSFVLQTKEDFRFIIPYVEFAKEAKGPRPMLLDTSVIIDGRIADIGDTRILESELIVPRFVLEEIQDIADSSDKLKRNRGRRGLDMLNRLQSNDKIDIRLTDIRTPAVEEATGVDQKLVALAQHLGGRIVTNDYNLNKIARLRGVDVININDLANALKPVVLPGETVTVKIIKPGEEIGQGVGYLDDGTMVVAEQGRDRLGQEMTIIVTSVLQTSAGRMIFGRPESTDTGRPRRT